MNSILRRFSLEGRRDPVLHAPSTAISKRLKNRTPDNFMVPWGSLVYKWDLA